MQGRQLTPPKAIVLAGVIAATAALIWLLTARGGAFPLTRADRIQLRQTASSFVAETGRFGFITSRVTAREIPTLNPDRPSDFITRAAAYDRARAEIAPGSALPAEAGADWYSTALYGQGWNSITATDVRATAATVGHRVKGKRLAAVVVQFVSAQTIRVEGDDDAWNGTLAVSEYQLPVTARLELGQVPGGAWKVFSVTHITLPNTLAISAETGTFPSAAATPVRIYAQPTDFTRPTGGWTAAQIARTRQAGTAALRRTPSISAQARASASQLPSCAIQKIVFGSAHRCGR